MHGHMNVTFFIQFVGTAAQNELLVQIQLGLLWFNLAYIIFSFT